MADDVAALLPDDEVLLVARTRLLPQADLVEWDVPADRVAVGRARREVDRRLTEWGRTTRPSPCNWSSANC